MENSFTLYHLSSAKIKTVCVPARILEAIADGRLEARVGLTITFDISQVMLCGNPDMLRDTTEILPAHGLKKNRRQEHGHITLESYW